MNEEIIRFEHFGFKYHAQSEPTLYDINLSIHAGEKILIAGPSGCGKSTLAHCINGLIPFTYKGEQSGSLTIGGRESRELSIFDISKIVGTVLQDLDGQFIGTTVGEDIAFVLENDCIETNLMHTRVSEAAARVDIADHLDHAPSELSGGQKQRVSMAGIMVGEVRVFLFDEPLANLDPATGKRAIEIIDDITKSYGATAIIIEHRLEDVLWRDVDRIVLMHDGRIVSDSPPDELLATDRLTAHGIREPLYLTALGYAGIDITEDMKPHSIKSLVLSDAQKQQVRSWYQGKVQATASDDRKVILEARHIDFTYENGYHALRDISLQAYEGELLAIVGTNGAGKTTLCKVICGFEKQQDGQILYDGEDIARLSIKQRAEYIGYVMQNPNQMISKSIIYDEVALGLRLRGVLESEIKDIVESTLQTCGLYSMRNWPLSAISYGQKKRATIASILALSPRVIILDEPTAGQDYRHYTDIMEFLYGLSQSGITVIMITHDMHLMLEYATRAIVFSDGRVIADDTSPRILTDPDIIQRASLKETSLYDLARICGISDETSFMQHFIDYERQVRV